MQRIVNWSNYIKEGLLSYKIELTNEIGDEDKISKELSNIFQITRDDINDILQDILDDGFNVGLKTETSGEYSFFDNIFISITSEDSGQFNEDRVRKYFPEIQNKFEYFDLEIYQTSQRDIKNFAVNYWVRKKISESDVVNKIKSIMSPVKDVGADISFQKHYDNDPGKNSRLEIICTISLRSPRLKVHKFQDNNTEILKSISEYYENLNELFKIVNGCILEIEEIKGIWTLEMIDSTASPSDKISKDIRVSILTTFNRPLED